MKEWTKHNQCANRRVKCAFRGFGAWPQNRRPRGACQDELLLPRREAMRLEAHGLLEQPRTLALKLEAYGLAAELRRKPEPQGEKRRKRVERIEENVCRGASRRLTRAATLTQDERKV